MLAVSARRTSIGLCLFRVAAGSRLGFGHLMRARSLARCLSARVVFSVRGGKAARHAARALGCKLATRSTRLRTADLTVVDDPSPRHSRLWTTRARRLGVPCVSVHDGRPSGNADLRIVGSLGAGRPRSRGAALVGPRFYLLDSRVVRLRNRAFRTRIRHRVLIALGGGRHVWSIAQPLVDEVRARNRRASVVVAPGFSPGRRPSLRGARWLTTPTRLVTALSQSDVAVVAGGVTLYEACALGVPSVALAVVPAQHRAIREFARRGAVLDAAAGPRGKTLSARAARSVAQLLAQEERRAAIAARARQLVDGRGAERSAAAIHALVKGLPRHA